jgi:gliding motility-associated lipoprotein GldH
MRNIYFLFLGLLISTFISCQKSNIKLSHQFDNDVWNSFDDVELKTKIDISKTYQIKVNIFVSEDFEPSNFSFGYSQNSEDGESVYFNYKIPVKSAEGKFVGDLKDGFYNYTIIIRSKTVFNSKGEYTFKFENIMNKFDMKGVHKIELQLTEI